MEPAQDPEGAAALEKAFADGEVLIGRDAHEKWTYFDSFLDPSLPELSDIEGARDSFDILGWDYEPGDVLLFHGHIVHSARGGGNTATCQAFPCVSLGGARCALFEASKSVDTRPATLI